MNGLISHKIEALSNYSKILESSTNSSSLDRTNFNQSSQGIDAATNQAICHIIPEKIKQIVGFCSIHLEILYGIDHCRTRL